MSLVGRIARRRLGGYCHATAPGSCSPAGFCVGHSRSCNFAYRSTSTSSLIGVTRQNASVNEARPLVLKRLAGNTPDRTELYAALAQAVRVRKGDGKLPDDLQSRVSLLLDEEGDGEGELDVTDEAMAPFMRHIQGMHGRDLTWLANRLMATKGVKNAPRVAARLYIVASEQGDGDAQYTLAQLLRIGGAGLAKDPEWAAALLKEAACDARPVAQLALGMMLMNGEAGPTDHTQAYAHILAAAANGFVAAHNVLGNMHLKGQGTPEDPTAAIECFRNGAQAGDGHAHMSLAKCYSEGVGVAESHQLAFEHHMAAAERGVAAGDFNVGYHYFMGRGVGQSFEEAARWYDKAARAGFTYAQVNLGNMYAEGRGVERDLHRARELYKEAAARDPHAKLLLLEVEDALSKTSP